jgi:hypothetical protein
MERPPFSPASGDEIREFEDFARGTLVALDFDALDMFLSRWFRDNPSAFSQAALDTRPADLSIEGWDEVGGDIAAMEAKGTVPTALGINLTGHWEGEGPGFETALYDDKSYDFSTGSRDAMAAAASVYGAPWLGRFVDVGAYLECRGMEQLYAAVTGYEHRYWAGGGPLPTGFVDFTMAHWLLHLRLCQAIQRDVARRGLPRKMAVIVSEHDFGPYFGTAFIAEAKASARAATQAVVDGRAEQGRQNYQDATHQMIAEFVERRSVVRNWLWFVRPGKKKKAREMIEAQEAMILSDMPDRPAIPTWKMKDAEFGKFIGAFRRWRDPSLGLRPPGLPPIAPAARSMLHEQVVVDYGIAFGGRWVRMNVLFDREYLAEGKHPVQTGVVAW